MVALRVRPVYASISPPPSATHLSIAIHLPIAGRRPLLPASSNAFTTTSPTLKSTSPAPSVRRALRRPPPGVQSPIQPLAANERRYLQAILRDSLSGLEPATAALVLRTFRDALHRSKNGVKEEQTQRIIDGTNISPNNMALLAHIVQAKRDPSNAPLASALWDAATARGSTAAALQLVDLTARRGVAGEVDVQRARAMVDVAATSGGPMAPAAGMMMGKLAEAEGRSANAERWAWYVVTRTKGVDQGDNEAFGEAWRMMARLRRGRKDRAGEREALEGGARMADDAQACFELAVGFMRGEEEQVRYRELLGRAAGSGIAEAAVALGRDLLREVRERGADARPNSDWRNWLTAILYPTTTVESVKAQAFEWFFVAAASLRPEVSAEAMLYLAMMLRDQGNLVQGVEMLDGAATSPRLLKRAIPLIREQWDDEKKRLLAINMDPILQEV